MALKKCRECSKEVSSTAKRCPHCGIKAPAGTAGSTWLIGGLLLAAIIGLAVSGNDNDTSRENSTAGIASTSSQDAPSNTAPDPTANWNVATRTSDIDDSTNVRVWTEALNTVRGTINQPVRPELYILCRENVTNLYVNWDQFLTIGNLRVLYRIDDQDAVQRTWRASTGNDAVGLWSGGQAIPMAKRLFGADRLLMRVTPHGEDPVAARFDISDLEEAITPLREACNW